MLQNVTQMHPGGKVDEIFQMQVIASHKSAFIRMVNEAVLIRNFKGLLLNSKLKYNQCLIPAIEVKSIRKPRSSKKNQELCVEEEKINMEQLDLPENDTPEFQAILQEYESIFSDENFPGAAQNDHQLTKESKEPEKPRKEE